MDMQIDILTLFPESVDAMLNVSILGRAQERGYIAIRTHQIRAHLASIGHPILGDTKYGNAACNQMAQRTWHLPYQLLHAYRVTFPEMKGTGEPLSQKSVTAPLPPLFSQILNAEE